MRVHTHFLFFRGIQHHLIDAWTIRAIITIGRHHSSVMHQVAFDKKSLYAVWLDQPFFQQSELLTMSLQLRPLSIHSFY